MPWVLVTSCEASRTSSATAVRIAELGRVVILFLLPKISDVGNIVQFRDDVM